MKKFLNIFAAMLLAVISTSCLDSNLEELEVYSGCDITRIDCYYRWVTDEVHPGTDAKKTKQTYVSAFSRTYVTDENDPTRGVCTITYARNNIPAEYKADCEKLYENERGMMVAITISTAATIKPLNGAPELGVPADWTNDYEYEVTAADGTKKIWKIVVVAGN